MKMLSKSCAGFFATSSIVENLNKLYPTMSGFVHLMHNFLFMLFAIST